MTIGTSIVLIAVGAVLKWAVTAHSDWISIQTTGTVLFVVGLFALAISLVYTFWSPTRDRADDAHVMRPPPQG